MNPYKIYVAVGVRFDREGRMTPLWIEWEDGRTYSIDAVRDVRRAARKRAARGCGIFAALGEGRGISIMKGRGGSSRPRAWKSHKKESLPGGKDSFFLLFCRGGMGPCGQGIAAFFAYGVRCYLAVADKNFHDLATLRAGVFLDGDSSSRILATVHHTHDSFLLYSSSFCMIRASA